jgi:HSP20 family protein
METPMADIPVEVKKAPQTATAVPEMWGSFRNDMDRLFDRFARGFGLPSLRSIADLEPPWRSFVFSAPPIDVSEDDEAYKISAELPGVDAKDVEVSVSGDRLVVKGEKHQQQEEKNKNYYLSERTYGSFERSFELPVSVDRDKIAADFSRGVLTITMPKTAEVQKLQKKIEIKSA